MALTKEQRIAIVDTELWRRYLSEDEREQLEAIESAAGTSTTDLLHTYAAMLADARYEQETTAVAEKPEAPKVNPHRYTR